MGGKRAAKTPRKSRTSPTMPDEEEVKMKTPQSLNVKSALKTPGKSAKKKASAFASKKSGSRRRKSEQRRATPAKPDRSTNQNHSDVDADSAGKDDSVDEILQQVRDLMRSGKLTEDKMGRDLMDALKKADETFNTSTAHDSSSSDETPPQQNAVKTAPPSSNKKRKRSKANTPAANKSSSSKALLDTSESGSKQHSDEAKTLEFEDNRKPPATTSKGPQPRSILSTPSSRRKGRPSAMSKIPMPRKGTPLSAKKTKATEYIDSSDNSDDEPSATQLKADIDALKKDDPDFYKFLEENDAALLDFSDTDADDVSSDGEERTAKFTESSMNAAHGGVSEAKQNNSLVDYGRKEKLEVDDEFETLTPNDSEEKGSQSEDSDDEFDEDTTIVNDDVRSTRHHQQKSAIEAEQPKEEIETPEDVTGYSESEDDREEEEEAATAIEATDSDNEVAQNANSGENEYQATRGIFVDMKYIRDLKASLKSNRSSLKVCKDLLKLLRAGREVIPKAKTLPEKKEVGGLSRSKPKRSHNQQSVVEEDLEPEIFTDDGLFTSGKVTFASASAYQQAMSLSITSIQEIFDSVLEAPTTDKASSLEALKKWNPTEKSRWSKVQPLFRPYVYHMILMCNSIKDPSTLRYLLKRLEKLVPYTKGVDGLARKITRVAVRVWSSGAHEASNATRLRGYLLLNRLAHGEGNAEVVLRSCCSSFSKNTGAVCNPKTLPMIHFSVMCLVELFGVDMGASYTTAFSHLREMSISLRAVLTAKDGKQEIERLHNWSYVNMLRLWGKVLGRYGSEDELRPLIYPYVQIALGAMRVNPSPRTHPMRLHIATFLSGLIEETGVFIPVLPHLLTILRCSELRRIPGRGSAKKLEWRSILRVNEEAVKTKLFLTGLVDHTVLQISKFCASISKHPAFPEIAHFALVTLKKFAKEFRVAEWRALLTVLVEKLKDTSDFIARTRAKVDYSPHGAISSAGMLATVPGIEAGFKTPIQRFFDIENSRIEKEGKLRDEKSASQARKSDDDLDDDSEREEKSEVEEEEEPARKKRRRNKPKQSNAPLLRLPDPREDPADEDQLAELNLDSDDDV
ncbi:Nucleolar complex protein [Gracilaria domingensis]|nr:Nucleolar complex protein [Gracilaria domingensis]